MSSASRRWPHPPSPVSSTGIPSTWASPVSPSFPATATSSFFSHDSAYFFGAPGAFTNQQNPATTHSDSDEEVQSDMEHALIDSLLEPSESKCTDPSDEIYHGSSLLRPMAVNHTESYASKLASTLSPFDAVASGATVSPSAAPAPSSKICPFFLQRSCRYASHCRYRHDFGSSCPQCGEDVPLDERSQELHVMQCVETITLNEERRFSSTLQCEICMENIVRSGRKFGLLQGCSHTFCLPCIRNWRGSSGQTKENLRACPLCRQESHFVIPSDRMVMDVERKTAVIEKYTSRLRQIECKWFARGKGTCPFGSSCFYAHTNEDGTVAEPERLQHGANADGLIKVMKPMCLSDFFG
uniref:RING-type E3 ubiquitin transferase n=1 Tax=Spongospora subterranea TaxID=70186 RepID=A0A0H5R759_9EUKA|eukprot:CRZ09661.1 hypothetical protein [Spongospora subterranea]